MADDMIEMITEGPCVMCRSTGNKVPGLPSRGRCPNCDGRGWYRFVEHISAEDLNALCLAAILAKVTELAGD